MRYKPTDDERDRIHAFAFEEAKRSGGFGTIFTVEPALRFNLADPERREEMNIHLVSADPEWRDTSTTSHEYWATFTRGFELSADGRALIDFYVYERGLDGGLVCNVQAEFDAKGLLALHADKDRNRWRRDEKSDE